MKIFRFVKKVFLIGTKVSQNWVRFHKRKFFECNSIELYFNEESRV